MNKDVIFQESVVIISSLVSILILHYTEINVQHSKLIYCLSNLSLLLLQVNIISNSYYSIIFIAIFILIIVYFKHQKQIDQNPPIININPDIVQNEVELPKQLPIIQSIHESNSSNNPIPYSTEGINTQQNQSNQQEQVNHEKKDSGLSFLGENRRSSSSKSNGQVVSRQQSLFQVQPNLNVIKYQDDGGEVKFGILKTLKSVSYDQVGKEVEIFQNAEQGKQLTRLLSNIEKTTIPRVQILYESTQQQYSVDDNLRNGIQFQEEENQGDQQIKQQNIWKKLFRELIFSLIIALNLQSFYNIKAIIFQIIMNIRQFSTFRKLQYNGLSIQLQCREIFIWIILIFIPLIGFTLQLLLNNNEIYKLQRWTLLVITLRYYKIIRIFPKLFISVFIIVIILVCLL